MLLPDNVHPESTLVYNGALILKALKNLETATVLDLFIEARKNGGMSMPLFVLSLDWLFLADCVAFNEGGDIALCS